MIAIENFSQINFPNDMGSMKAIVDFSVHGVMHDGEGGFRRAHDNETPDLYSVYAVDPKGMEMWVADVESNEGKGSAAAKNLVSLLRSIVGLWQNDVLPAIRKDKGYRLAHLNPDMEYSEYFHGGHEQPRNLQEARKMAYIKNIMEPVHFGNGGPARWTVMVEQSTLFEMDKPGPYEVHMQERVEKLLNLRKSLQRKVDEINSKLRDLPIKKYREQYHHDLEKELKGEMKRLDAEGDRIDNELKEIRKEVEDAYAKKQ